MSELRYVYGIVPASAADAVARAGLAGIDGAAVGAIVEGPLAGAWSAVDGREYATDALNEHVREMEWLTPRAAAHQAVNARLLEIADAVIPLSFGALYRDDGRVRAMLREDVAAREDRLATLRGRAEWVVTVTRGSGDGVAKEELETIDREIAESTPGRAFLLEKRRTSVASELVERADADAADRALAVLEGASERAYREPVAKGSGDPVVLRVSLLAPRGRASELDGAIASLARDLEPRGYLVRSTGPWPAYRFGSLS